MDIKKAFLFFKNLHKNQTYSDWSQYRPHLLRVGNILQHYLDLFWEFEKEMSNSITIAWYWHDSLEDTDISLDTLQETFWNTIANLIWGMTNEQSDTHTDIYVQKICRAEEEIRLIKLADLCDNYSSIVYRALENNPQFLKEKILPIMEPMYQEIITTSFVKYPKTWAEFLSNVKKCHDLADTYINFLCLN